MFLLHQWLRNDLIIRPSPCVVQLWFSSEKHKKIFEGQVQMKKIKFWTAESILEKKSINKETHVLHELTYELTQVSLLSN